MDQHAVFAVLDDGRRVRVSPYLPWRDAIAQWETADNIRVGEAIDTNVRYFAVRDEGDPDWNTAEFVGLPTVTAIKGGGTIDDRAVLRRLGNERGLEGREGGWIYRNGRPVTQGWGALKNAYQLQGLLVYRVDETQRPGHRGRWYANEYRNVFGGKGR